MHPSIPTVSIVCPSYNEADRIDESIAKLRDCIDLLLMPAEVLIINDGSNDETVAKALLAVDGDDRFRIISHKVNFGRGRALRTGFREARGAIIVTTEGDLSWGRDVIARMVEELSRDAGLDAVFASTHLPGGGYRNVPRLRVFLSHFGNRILRFLYSGKVSMTTGMTRAYRARVIKGEVFLEDDKEIHLEIAHRLLSIGARISEVPAVLSWPKPKAGTPSRAHRTNWPKIRKLVGTHLAFGLFRGFSKILVPVLVVMSLSIFGFGGWAVWRLIHGTPSIYLAQLTGVLTVLWVTLTLGHYVIYQARHIERSQWKTQNMLCNLFEHHGFNPDGRSYYHEIDVCESPPIQERVAA